jgi:hypothetical protein
MYTVVMFYTLPVAVTSVETSFITFRIIEYYKVNWVGQTRLWNAVTGKTDIKEFVSDFVNVKWRKTLLNQE